jgi:hypothetical protein
MKALIVLFDRRIPIRMNMKGKKVSEIEILKLPGEPY